MPLQNPGAWFDGTYLPAAEARRVQIALARGNEGIAAGPHLRVLETAPRSNRVRILSGIGIVWGRDTPWQGFYIGSNVGDDFVAIPPTGGVAAHYILALEFADRNERIGGGPDPQTDGVQWGVYPVAANTVAPPSGVSAIALARIDVPPNTSIITDAMITDLRKVANPRRTRLLLEWGVQVVNDLIYTPPAIQGWPQVANTDIGIPPWATSAQVRADVIGVYTVNAAAPVTPQSVAADYSAGYLWAFLAGVETGKTPYYAAPWNGAADRRSYPIGGWLSLPGGVRGTDQLIQLRGQRYTGTPGKLRADTSARALIDVEFIEGPF